jgi:hypothetical protein
MQYSISVYLFAPIVTVIGFVLVTMRPEEKSVSDDFSPGAANCAVVTSLSNTWLEALTKKSDADGPPPKSSTAASVPLSSKPMYFSFVYVSS